MPSVPIGGSEFHRRAIEKLLEQIGIIQVLNLQDYTGLFDALNAYTQIAVQAAVTAYKVANPAQTMTDAEVPLNVAVVAAINTTFAIGGPVYLEQVAILNPAIFQDIIGSISDIGTVEKPGALFNLPPPA